MTYPHLKPEPKAKIKPIVVEESGGAVFREEETTACKSR
jgi:hypothetical protein